MEIVFLWPFVALLLLLPFFVRLLSRPIDFVQSRQALCVPFYKDVQKQGRTSFIFRFDFLSFVFSLAYVFLVVSAMRPVSFGEAIYMPSRGRQIMLVLDVSASMNSYDIIWKNQRMTRLMAVKNIADVLEVGIEILYQ